MAAITSSLICSGCGYQPSSSDPLPFECPNRGDGRDHVQRRALSYDDAGGETLQGLFSRKEPNPFVRYRELLHSYRTAIESGLSDRQIKRRIETLDAAIKDVDGRGFNQTPFFRVPQLAADLGVEALWVKDETDNVSGSHKARHLAGIELWLDLHQNDRAIPLAIASCGNAALGAAVVARASGRQLQVFVPPDAEPSTLARLRRLGSHLVLCERQPGERGDPCYLRFREAVASGALPFTCQGNENAITIDGGKTLAWEMVGSLASESASLDRLFVQVGGGALATACIEGLKEARRLGVMDTSPRFHAVQTEGAHPLERAWQQIAERVLERTGEVAPPREMVAERARLVGTAPQSLLTTEIAYAVAHRDEFMWPWEETPVSIAGGILDDETYDWMTVVEGMLTTGGYPVTVSEEELRQANDLARDATDVAVDATGTAGLAGSLALSRCGELDSRETVGVLFTGSDRSA